MIYENIPALVTSTVQSLYHGVGVTMNFSLVARALDFVQTNNEVASTKVILSQISLVLCIVLALVIVYTMMQKRALKTETEILASVPPIESALSVVPSVLRERWDTLMTHLDSAQEVQWKMAVIEADKLVDDALGKAGFSGDTFGDRLSNIQPGTLLSLDGIWWAHKVRNRLTHEIDYFLRYTEARQAVGYYEAALVELKLL